MLPTHQRAIADLDAVPRKGATALNLFLLNAGPDHSVPRIACSPGADTGTLRENSSFQGLRHNPPLFLKPSPIGSNAMHTQVKLTGNAGFKTDCHSLVR